MELHSKKFRFSSIEEALAFYEVIGECHIWKGSQSSGYGTFQVKGKAFKAHRAAYEAKNGSIPPKLFICHRCHIKNCINADHLYAGTGTENARDRARNSLDKEMKSRLAINPQSLENFHQSFETKKFTMIFSRPQFDELKMMCHLTRTSMSNFIRIAIIEKIKQIKQSSGMEHPK